MNAPPLPARIDALLFDLGGVLIDINSEPVFAYWARCCGVPPDTLRARFHVDERYWQFERGQCSTADYFAHLRQLLDVDLADADLLTGWNALLGPEKAGVGQLLKLAASRYPLYLFSNTNSAHQAVWSVTSASLLAPFTRLFVSSEIGHRKPDVAAFRYVAEAIGRPAERILFFDDAAENVAGARESGMAAVHVRETGDIATALDVLAARDR